MSAESSTTSIAPTASGAHPNWRRFAAVAAVGAPVAEGLSVVLGVEHTEDTDRQLDIIHAHIASFTTMVLLENLCWILVAVTAVAVALRLASSRGGTVAALGAVLAVVGCSASTAGFGGVLPTLSKPEYRDAALYFTDHIGPIYNVTQGLVLFLYLGLLLMFFALWRSGSVAWPWLAVCTVALVASAVIGSGRVENTVAMVVLAAGFVGVARFLASPRT